MPDRAAHWLLVFSALAAVSFFCAGLTSYFERRPEKPLWVRGIHDTGMLLSLAHLLAVFLLEPRSDGYAAAVAPMVALDHVVVFVVSSLMVLITVTAAFREERVWLSSPRADAYREYRNRTGMFVPKLWNW